MNLKILIILIELICVYILQIEQNVVFFSGCLFFEYDTNILDCDLHFFLTKTLIILRR